MADFNQQYADQLHAQHRYFELADYLKQYNNGNQYNRQLGYQQIVGLEQQGRLYNALYNKANPQQRQAIDFLQTVTSYGDFERNQQGQIINPFGKAYVDAVNRLGSTDTNNATSVSVKFEPKKIKRSVKLFGLIDVDWLAADEEYDDNAFDLYLAQNHLTKEQLKSIDGVEVKESNGITTLNIKKNSSQFYSLMLGLQNVDTNHSIKAGAGDNENADKRYFIAGLDGKNNLIANPNTDEVIGGNSPTNPPRMISNEYRGDDPQFNGYARGGKDNTINDLFKQAKALQDEVTGGEPQHISVDLMVSSASSAQEEKIRNAYNMGMISKDDFKQLLEDNTENLNNQVIGKGLSNATFYVSGYKGDNGEDNKSREYEKVDNEDSRTYYNDLIKTAAMEGRIKYYMAASGNSFGTKMVIIPKKPSTQDATDANTEKDKQGVGPEIAVPIEIYVEDWNGQDAEQSLRRNTKTRAALEANAMEQYDYDLDIPQEGTLSHKNGAFSLYTNGNEQLISKDDAQRLLNKKFILDDSFEEAKGAFINPMDGSSLIYDSQGKLNQAAYRTALQNAYKLIDIRSQQAMQDLYPETIAHMSQYKEAGIDVSDMQTAYDKERESIAAYIKSLLTQDNS